MARLRRIQCDRCNHSALGKLKLTLLGFRTYTCPSCSTAIKMPLKGFHRGAYWAVIAVVTVIVVAGNGAPGLIVLLMAYALYKDWQLRKDPHAPTLTLLDSDR